MIKNNNLDFLTGREHNNLTQFEDYKIHKEVLPSFLALRELAKKEEGIDLAIVSSYRNFERQRVIWNEKVLGKRKTFDDHGSEVDLIHLSDEEKIHYITRFSAIPGASRHHWGTDIDIYDRNELSKDELQLTPAEYAPSGVFGKLSKWLSDKISSGENFGFFRPYSQDLGGIHPEMWHLSFAPLSSKYMQEYDLELFKSNLAISDIELKTSLIKHSESLFSKLILNISDS